MITWAVSPEDLETDLEDISSATSTLIIRQLANAIFETGLISEPIPVSSKNEEGLIELHGNLTRILSRGEEATS